MRLSIIAHAPECIGVANTYFSKYTVPKAKPERLFANSEHYVECHLYDEKTVVEGGVIER